jgi:hypothetical protein
MGPSLIGHDTNGIDRGSAICSGPARVEMMNRFISSIFPVAVLFWEYPGTRR